MDYQIYTLLLQEICLNVVYQIMALHYVTISINFNMNSNKASVCTVGMDYQIVNSKHAVIALDFAYNFVPARVRIMRRFNNVRAWPLLN